MEIDRNTLLTSIAQKIDEWKKNPERMQSGYSYEKTFVDMWQSLGNEVFQESIGKLPKSRNGKKNFKPVGEK
jgi:hypothetical protein